jgi:protein-L-isoaspartate O-methyltransferase
MNMQAIETVVRRLFSDAAFRARAIADPATALAEYRLASSEQQALTKLCLQLNIGGTSVEDKVQAGGWW